MTKPSKSKIVWTLSITIFVIICLIIGNFGKIVRFIGNLLWNSIKENLGIILVVIIILSLIVWAIIYFDPFGWSLDR